MNAVVPEVHPRTDPVAVVLGVIHRLWSQARRLLPRALDLISLIPTIQLFRAFSAPMFGLPLGYDEQVFVWCGWSILKGLVPYRDFIEFKPPLIPLTHALALRLFGFEHCRFRIFFAIFSLAAILALQIALLTRGAGRLMTAALVAGIVYLFVNFSYHDTSLADTESIGFSYYFFGVAALLVKTKYRDLTNALGGAFLVCCVLSKEPFGGCVIPTWVACYFAVDRREPFRAAALRYFKTTALGGVIVVVALCAYMIPNGAMKHYFALLNWYRTLFRDPLQGYCVQLGVFRPTTFWEDLPRFWTIIEERLVNPNRLGFLAPFFLMPFVFVTRRSLGLLAASLAAFAGALYAPTVSLCFWNHYFVMAESGTFFFCVAGLLLMTPSFRASRRRIRIWSSLAVATIVGLQVWPAYDVATPVVVNFETARVLETEPGTIDFIKANTAPTDKIFTTGVPGLYVATNRLHAVKLAVGLKEFLSVLPGTTDAEKLRPLYQELVASRPKIVYLDPEQAERKQRYADAVYYPFLKEFKYVEVRPHLYLRPN